MHSEFGETQFAIAFMHEYLTRNPHCIFYAPTQREERNCGFDVKLQTSKGIPVFYQFKVSEYLGYSGREYRYFKSNYYRFHTYYSAPEHNQHNILKKLTCCFSKVFYVAPCFYKFSDFNLFLSSGRIIDHSRFIRIKALPEINDNLRHSICYLSSSNRVAMFSEPFFADDGSLDCECFESMCNCDSSITLEEFSQTIRNTFDFSSRLEELGQDLYLKSVGDYFMRFGIFFCWMPLLE